MRSTISILLVCLMVACATPVSEASQRSSLVAAGPFVPAAAGCSMAHCDPQMSDSVGLDAPAGPTVVERWRDRGHFGSWIGLGCSSNGALAACTYTQLICTEERRDNLHVYDAEGNLQWTGPLGIYAWTSAPMIDAEGGVIAADEEYLWRFDPTGAVIFQTRHPVPGAPISPVQTEDGAILVATKALPATPCNEESPGGTGPMFLYDDVDGGVLGDFSVPGFDTANTPGVRGNRGYVTMAASGSGAHPPARLQAVDVDRTASPAITAGPAFTDFVGPSGASPLVVGDRVYFDGHRCTRRNWRGECTRATPIILAVRDTGAALQLLWTQDMPGDVTASLAHDPRGGVWSYGIRGPLQRFSELPIPGTRRPLKLQEIDVDPLVGAFGVHFPSSVMTIAGDPSAPVMIVTANSLTQSTWVLGIDLLPAHGRRLWRYQTGTAAGSVLADFTAAQFAIVEDDEGEPVVVFPTMYRGARGIGAPR